MFMRKRNSGSAPQRWVDSFDAPEVKAALRGNWLTLALAQFEVPFTSPMDRDHLEPSTARGVVHFAVGYDRMMPAELTLLEDQPVDRSRVGRAQFNLMRGLGSDPAHVLLEVRVNDSRGKIGAKLQDAFTSAAVSQTRFVHVSFRREEQDVETMLQEVQKQRYGASHDLIEIAITRTTHLPNAPDWAWNWHRTD